MRVPGARLKFQVHYRTIDGKFWQARVGFLAHGAISLMVGSYGRNSATKLSRLQAYCRCFRGVELPTFRHLRSFICFAMLMCSAAPTSAATPYNADFNLTTDTNSWMVSKAPTANAANQGVITGFD